MTYSLNEQETAQLRELIALLVRGEEYGQLQTTEDERKAIKLASKINEWLR